jgi:hypothetical protein
MRDAIQAYADATWAAEAAVRGAAEADSEQGVRSVLLNNRLWICAGEEGSKGGRRVSQAQLFVAPQAPAAGGRPGHFNGQFGWAWVAPSPFLITTPESVTG